MENKGNGRLLPLDSMRGVASVIIACMFHYQFIFDCAGEVHPLYGIPIIWQLTKYGGCFVEMFFIISGLLAYRLYYRAISGNALSFKTYLFGKVYRLFPMMYFALIFLASMQWLSFALSGSYFYDYCCDGLHFVLNLLGIQYAWIDMVANFNQPSWYISVLLMCYVLFYILCKVKSFVFSSTGLFVFAIFAGWVLKGFGWTYPILNNFMGRGIYSFFIGVCLGVLLEVQEPRLVKAVQRTAVFLLSLMTALYGLKSYAASRFGSNVNIFGDYGVSLAVIFFPCVIYLSLTVKQLYRFFSLDPLLWLGKCSYAIYLLNLPIFYAEHYVITLFDIHVNYSSIGVFLILNGILIAAAVLVHYWFEVPMVARMKRKAGF